MEFLLLFAMLVAAVCAVAVTRSIREPEAARPWRGAAPDPATREGALAAQLLSGEITHGQYARAMEGLADRS